MNKKRSRCIFYGLCLITSGFLVSCSDTTKKNETDQPRPVQAIKVNSSSTINGRSFPGRAIATQEINLSFNVSGTLMELPVKIGDKIKTGALIARLDPKEFEVKLKSANAELMRDEKNFQRAKQLIQKGNISQVDYDLLETKLSVTQANLALAEKALKDTVIKAPFNGQIASVSVENYQTVASKQVIARLLDTSEIEMVIQIPENLISAIPKVDRIVVQFDAFPQELIPATIKEISNEASPETRTYPVTLLMQQPKSIEILPGMAGKAKGSVTKNAEQTNTLTIPASSLLTHGSDHKSYVWVIDTKTLQVHQHEVQIGELTPTGISILDGLTSGEWIVTAGIHSLEEGEKVTILNQSGN
jgi:RND family efflux transporter MFP subunit